MLCTVFSFKSKDLLVDAVRSPVDLMLCFPTRKYEISLFPSQISQKDVQIMVKDKIL